MTAQFRRSRQLRQEDDAVAQAFHHRSSTTGSMLCNRIGYAPPTLSSSSSSAQSFLIRCTESPFLSPRVNAPPIPSANNRKLESSCADHRPRSLPLRLESDDVPKTICITSYGDDPENLSSQLGFESTEPNPNLVSGRKQSAFERNASSRHGSLLRRGLLPIRSEPPQLDDQATLVLDDLHTTSSLIFPLHYSRTGRARRASDASATRQRKILAAVSHCRNSIWFLQRRKLWLERMNLTTSDLPMIHLVETALGATLRGLFLARNTELCYIPESLVQSLPALQTLDLSHCNLSELPLVWDLPRLSVLNLSHNRLTEFPEDVRITRYLRKVDSLKLTHTAFCFVSWHPTQSILIGLPALKTLVLYGNRVSQVMLPQNIMLLSSMEYLNIGYNDLAWLPDSMSELPSLRKLDVMNNLLTSIPRAVCKMKTIRHIDASSNPIADPPIEICERGICAMRKYWDRVCLEEQSKRDLTASLSTVGEVDLLVSSLFWSNPRPATVLGRRPTP
jgi:Leucine Rich repeats (2 copies)